MQVENCFPGNFPPNHPRRKTVLKTGYAARRRFLHIGYLDKSSISNLLLPFLAWRTSDEHSFSNGQSCSFYVPDVVTDNGDDWQGRGGRTGSETRTRQRTEYRLHGAGRRAGNRSHPRRRSDFCHVGETDSGSGEKNTGSSLPIRADTEKRTILPTDSDTACWPMTLRPSAKLSI